MQVHPIRTERDHREALERIQALWNANEGTTEFEELDVLATLVDAFERQAYVQQKLSPVDAIRAHMEMTGRTQSDLAALLTPSRASEILTRTRPLTLEMIRALNAKWGIPAECLTASYRLRSVPKNSGRKPTHRARQSEAKTAA